jgi:hypothetical protein
MTRSAIHVAVVAILLAIGAGLSASPMLGATPIARYPLQNDGLDALGLNGAMTILNAPFQDDGIYCNGIYPADPGGFMLESPAISAMDLSSFAASAEFKISEYPSLAVYWAPIIVGGSSFRWIGAECLPDSTISLMYNNGTHVHTTTRVSLDEWHKLVVSYDSATRTGSLYLDNTLATSAEFDLVHGGDKDWMAYDLGSGRAFKGLLRELVIYDTAYDPTPAGRMSWGRLRALYRP